LRRVLQGENLLVVISLAAMMLLPVVEILLRAISRPDFQVRAPLFSTLLDCRHAGWRHRGSRFGRLLALSPVQTLLKGKAEGQAQIFSAGFAAAISFFLCFASIQYVKA